MTAILASPARCASAVPDLRASADHCRGLVRASGSSFYQGMRLIPEPLRTDTFILYSWLRHADDLADNPGVAADKARQLRRFWEHTCRCAQGGTPVVPHGSIAHTAALWPAFTDLLQRRTLPLTPLRDLVSGQMADLSINTYATFEDLRKYCYNVASTVGLLCIELWGYDGGAATRELAVRRGVAFQLTNIVRDVREDALAGRVYLPACYTRGPITPADVLAGRESAKIGIDMLLQQAAGHYLDSAELDAKVHPVARNCLWAMTERYRSLWRKIGANPTAVFSPQRVRLSAMDKFRIVVKATLR